MPWWVASSPCLLRRSSSSTASAEKSVWRRKKVCVELQGSYAKACLFLNVPFLGWYSRETTRQTPIFKDPLFNETRPLGGFQASQCEHAWLCAFPGSPGHISILFRSARTQGLPDVYAFPKSELLRFCTPQQPSETSPDGFYPAPIGRFISNLTVLGFFRVRFNKPTSSRAISTAI